MADRLLEFRALAHPARLQLLSLLSGAALSAAEAAREMGMSQANTSYHLRLLERAELVQVVEELTVRGGKARRYRHVSSSTVRPADPDRTSTPQAREAEDEFVRLVAQELLRRWPHRDHAGLKTNIDAELWVSPQAWSAAVEAVAHASAQLHAAADAPRTPGCMRVSVSAALFQMRHR